MRICREEKLPVCAALMAVAIWAKTLDGKEVMIEWKKKDQYGRILYWINRLYWGIE